MVGGAPKCGIDGALHFAVVTRRRSLCCDEDEGRNSPDLDLTCPECLSKDPPRAVPSDRLSDLLPRQERYSRRAVSQPVPQSEELGPDRLALLKRIPDLCPAPDDAVSAECLARQAVTYRVVKRFLPLARRRASTFLPPGVELRLRNPCFRLPFRFFG